MFYLDTITIAGAITKDQGILVK